MIFINYFLYFIIYSFVGWLMEVSVKLEEFHRFVNRGFLIGPICPIYGFGVLTIVLIVGKTTDDVLGVFLKSILVCSLLEYITSYLMEKIFKARWWDYSTKKFNLNGRICLETMIPFGLLGTIVIYLVHPFVSKMVLKLPKMILIILFIVLLTIFIVDNFISFFVMNKIKKEIKNNKKDNTEIIREKVLEWLSDNKIIYRRLKNAYPNFVINIKQVRKALVDNINEVSKSKRKK